MDPIQTTIGAVTNRPAREVAPARSAAAVESTDPETPPSDAVAEERKTAKPEQPALDMRESVERLNDLIQSVRRELSFSIDQDSGRTVIQVIDSKTQEIVRQIPAEEVMTLVERLGAQRPSLMADLEA